MDALLRYLLNQIAYSLLYLELWLMAFCAVSIVITKLITRFISNWREKKQGEISSILEKAFLHNWSKEKIEIPSHLRQFRNLVEVLEKFNQRFNDEKWTEIRELVVEKYLIPSTDSYSKSFSWFKRQLAARAFLLSPKQANEKTLRRLLEDQRYLVRVGAAVCITQTPYKDLFRKVIEKMSQETQLSQFPYRDALLTVDQEKYQWMEEWLRIEKDPKLIAIFIDILSQRYSKNLYSLIRPYVNDQHVECRLLAVRALGGIPSEESIHLLQKHLSDSDWKIRAEAVLGLQKLYALQSVPQLEILLDDPVWWVRLQAALTLKEFGVQGMQALQKQDRNLNPKAYEIAQYTLALPQANS